MQSVTAQSQEMGDPLYDRQWHLENTGRNTSQGIPGEDINVEPVWNTTLTSGVKIRGQGTYIAIVDGDLPIARQSTITELLAHPDLIENISTRHSVDYYPSVIDDDSHATAVAGIAAGRGYNAIGVRGVAPWAKVYSLNILGLPNGNRSISRIIERSVGLDAMVRHTTITAVSNNSWGSLAPFSPSGDALVAWEMAIETGIRNGFYGKGTVYTWAGGNGSCIRRRVSSNRYEQVCNVDTSNYDGRAKYHAVVAVCSVDNQGRHLAFSELGANLWVCAPSRGITTTSRGRRVIIRDRTIISTYRHDLYTTSFGGTSASTPMVSGVVALIRQVNPSLSWRDVKLILANSARQNDPEDDDWAQGAVKYGLSGDEDEARYHFNHKYGFGVVDAQKAVELAQGWINLPPVATTYTEVINRNIDLRLSADNLVINSSISVQSDINFIEHVQVPIGLTHPLIQDLSVELTSPSGVTSDLIIPSTHPISSTSSYAIGVSGFWRFGSSAHLGEDPSGVWRLRFESTRPTTGTLITWGVRIRGYQIKMDATSAVGLSGKNVVETPLPLSLIGASWEEDLQPEDFRLKNAPTGLRIASVSRTSDTQVALNLALDGRLARDYLFQVEATTSTVPNIRNSLISDDISIVLEVPEAPLLEITAQPEQAIEAGNSAEVEVSVADNNFDVGDRVTLTAESSSRTIVSVTTSAKTDEITTNTSITFTLTAVQGGEAMVTFTATDSRGLSVSKTILVRVDAMPTGRVGITPDSDDRWLLHGTSTIMDANGIAEKNYRWYRNDRIISGATGDSYEIPDNRNGRATGTRYRLEVSVVDNIGQSVTTQSNTITVANEAPVIDGQITALPSPVEEGRETVITVPAGDANYDSLTYSWSATGEHSGINISGNPATLIIPPDFVDAASTETTANLEVVVDDGSAATTGMVSVVVHKINNGSLTLRISIAVGSRATTLTAEVLSDDPDGGTSGTVVYQWQVCEGSRGRCPPPQQWQNIDEATQTQYIILGSSILVGNNRFSLVEGSSIFRIQATYRDGQGYQENVRSAERIYTTRPVLRIRSKVFLEGPLQ